MDFVAARQTMVDSQVRTNDVTDRALQAALLATPRETLCPKDKAFAAYAEIEVELGAGRRLMIPRDVSKLLQAVEARPGERALVIGGPYAAAVLAAMGLKVTAQEADAAVLDSLKSGLDAAGVETAVGPFDQPAGADWDVIVSEGGVAEVPQAWMDALNVGGRLAVVEREGPTGKATLYVRTPQGLSRRRLFDAAPAILPGMERKPAFQF